MLTKKNTQDKDQQFADDLQKELQSDHLIKISDVPSALFPNPTPNSRSEQARINGRKSRGPVSPSGKEKVSANALKHGFTSTVNILLSIEEEPEFLLHMESYRANFNPRNYVERSYVDRLAAVDWRHDRLVTIEATILEAQMTLQDDELGVRFPDSGHDNHLRLAFAWQSVARPAVKTDPKNDHPTVTPEFFDINSLQLLRRYLTSLERQHRNILTSLRQYRKDFFPTALPDPAPVPEPAPAPEPAAAPKTETKSGTNKPNAQVANPGVEPQTPAIATENKPANTPVRPIRLVKPGAKR